MSLLTTRLGIKKPQDPDPFLASDFQQNYDLIDSYPGVFVCTQGTRPVWGSAQAGQLIFCTDTRILYEWTGSSFREPLVSPGAWVLNTTLNTTLTPPGGLGYAIATYTVGTFTSSRACAGLLIGELDFVPPAVYYDLNVNIVLQINGHDLSTFGGSFTQQGDFTNISGGMYSTSTSLFAFATTGGNAINIGSNTVSVKVSIADNGADTPGPTPIQLNAAAMAALAVNNSSQ